MIDLDYKVLKYLYKVSEHKVGDIAIFFTLPHSTLGSSVKRLEQEMLVKYERYQVVELTNKGKALAIELCRHAQILEVFLCNELDLTADQAHYECEKFNLLFSCEIINKICEKYNHPDKCPCGDTILSIPDCSCEDYLSKN